MSKYAQTQKELAIALGISEPAVCQNWLKKSDFPEKGKSGWNIVKCQEYVKAAHQKQLDKFQRSGGDVKTDLQCQKLKKQIERIDFDLEKEKMKYIAIKDHNQVLSKIASVVQDAHIVFVNMVKATIKDPTLITSAEHIVNSVREKIKEELNAYAETID